MVNLLVEWWLPFIFFIPYHLNALTGVDVTANQDEISDNEKYQLEHDVATGRWYIRTMQDKYWTLEAGGGIQANANKPWVWRGVLRGMGAEGLRGISKVF